MRRKEDFGSSWGQARHESPHGGEKRDTSQGSWTCWAALSPRPQGRGGFQALVEELGPGAELWEHQAEPARALLPAASAEESPARPECLQGCPKASQEGSAPRSPRSVSCRSSARAPRSPQGRAAGRDTAAARSCCSC